MPNSNIPIHTASVADLADAIAAAIAGGAETLADVIDQLQLVVTSLSDVDLNTDGVETLLTNPAILVFRSIDVDETEEEIKATAGNVYGFYFYNKAATIMYLKMYNATATNVTVGTTTPWQTFPLGAGQGALVPFTKPIPFSTALCIAATTGIADNDTGAPAANDVTVNLYYV